jgi:outer membrane protein OmpA-like peptidoglycan-associated protein
MKTSNLVLLVVVAASLAIAHPANDGSFGLFRTISADNGSAGHFHVGLWLRGFGETKDVAVLGEQAGEASHKGGDLFFGLGYAVTDNFAFNIAGSFHGDGIDYTTSDYTRASMGMGDTKIALKFGLGKENIKFGISPFISLPTGQDRDMILEDKSYLFFGDASGNDGGVFRYFSSGATDMGIVGLLTLKSKLMTVDFNFGYVDRNKNDSEIGWRNNYTIYRAAFSWDLGTVVPFIELGGIDFCGKDQFFTFIDDDSVFGPNPVYITPGISIRPGNFNIDLCVDIRGWEGENKRAFPTPITDSTNTPTGYGVAPAWAGIIGISYCHDFSPEMPDKGMIAGSVFCSKSDEPLKANLGLHHAEGLIASTVSDPDGRYSFEDIEPGTYKLTASAIDYKPYSAEILVKAGETTPLDIMLEPIEKQGKLVLRVVDLKSQEPMTAQISIGDDISETVTGEFEQVLDPGSYTVNALADAEDYIPYTREIVIEAGKTLELEIALVKKEFKIVLPEVYFETAKAELKPESHDKLDEAVATIRKVLSGNPDIIIEVQGHTDSRGSAEYNMNLSNDRANAVKDYLVTKHNIEESRLVAKGYGESDPVASNNTVKGMAKNRRVVFVIIK